MGDIFAFLFVVPANQFGGTNTGSDTGSEVSLAVVFLITAITLGNPFFAHIDHAIITLVSAVTATTAHLRNRVAGADFSAGQAPLLTVVGRDAFPHFLLIEIFFLSWFGAAGDRSLFFHVALLDDLIVLLPKPFSLPDDYWLLTDDDGLWLLRRRRLVVLGRADVPLDFSIPLVE